MTITVSAISSAHAGAPSWSATDVQVTTVGGQTEPYIAVKSSAAPDTLVAVNLQSSLCKSARTTDGGATWPSADIRTLPAPSWANNGSSDPVITSDTTGKFTAVCMGLSTTTPGLWKTTSTDGITWAAGSTIHTNPNTNFLDDKPWIAADINTASPFKDRVYICWVQQDNTNPSNKIRNILFMRLGVDSAPQTLASLTGANDNNFLHGCYVAVGPVQNEVYVVWAHYKSSTSIDIYLKRNDNGGDPANWQPNRAISLLTRLSTCSGLYAVGCLSGTGSSVFRVDSFPRMSVDFRSSTGIHMVWTHNNGVNKADIFYKDSYNCGKNSNINNCTFNTSTVTPGLQINSVGTNDQFQPAIEVRKSTTFPEGTVHVTALDRRSDTNNINWETWHYHCHTTSLGGCTGSGDWTGANNQKLVSNAVSNNLGLGIIGDYHGVTGSSTREAHAVWTDSRTGTLQIFSDRTTSS